MGTLKQLQWQYQRSLTIDHYNKYKNNGKIEVLWELLKYDTETWCEVILKKKKMVRIDLLSMEFHKTPIWKK